MARDTEKNDYITLAIPRDSPLYRALLADAEASGKALSAVAHLRLADYYRGQLPDQPAWPGVPRFSSPSPPSSSLPAGVQADNGVLYPKILPKSDIGARVTPATTPAIRSTTTNLENEKNTEKEEVDEFSLTSDQTRANAIAALEAFDVW